MKKIDCVIERPAKIAIAMALVLMALGMTVVGVVLIPVIGVFMAIPVFVLAGYFAFSPRSQECTL